MSDSAQEPQAITPFEFLQGFEGAPSQDQIDSWKSQAPGARVRLFHSSDGKRIYIMRGIGASELAQLQASLPANIAPDRLPSVIQSAVAVRCNLWTNSTIDKKLSDLALQAAGAGLPGTLHEIVCQLSDYMDPESISRFSADL
jgi:hypothetical protein